MLTQNNLEIEIADYISETEPDWEKIMQRFLRYFAHCKKFEEGGIRAILSEFDLEHKIWEMNIEHENRVWMRPVKYGRWENFCFSYIPGTNELRLKERNGPYYSCIDQIADIDNLITLFQITVRGSVTAGEDKRTQHMIEAIEKTSEVVTRYLKRKRHGAIIITFPHLTHHPHLEAFKEQGGLVRPFYYTKDDYRKKVAELIEEYDLMVR